MASITIPVEAALQIAENNGGAQFRKEVDNNCGIRAMLRDEKNEEVWYIRYNGFASYDNEYFRLKINAETGEWKKIK